MDLLTTAATWALGAFTLMVALSLVMVPVVAYFIFKNRKEFFDDFTVRRLHNQGQQPIPPKSPMPPLKKPKK